MVHTPRRYTAEEYAALCAEMDARDLALHEAAHEALGRLVAMKRLKLAPMNRNLLWAEWHYAKAMDELYPGDFRVMFEEACQNLRVDEEGEPDPGDYAADYAEYCYKRDRDDEMVRQWEAGQ